jgi:DNA-directed RNA polymerase sigma subunit (sigma70/sigma32)
MGSKSDTSAPGPGGSDEYMRRVRETVRWAFAHPEVIADLHQREQELLRLRFGAEGNEVAKPERIAEVFNIVRERVRMLEARVIKRLIETRFGDQSEPASR